MPDLLIELFSEEIPARMQAKAADDLRSWSPMRWSTRGSSTQAPRRLRPRVGWRSRCMGCRRGTDRRRSARVRGSAGRKKRSRVSQGGGVDVAGSGENRARSEEGRFLCCPDRQAGRAGLDVIAASCRRSSARFPWPKSMRWGEARQDRAPAWVRPLHSIVATFGIDTEEPEVVKFEVDGIEAGHSPMVIALWRRRRSSAPLRGL